MKPRDAANIKEKWGNKPCDHPDFSEESGVRFRSGDYYCTQCGSCFPYSEYKELIDARAKKNFEEAAMNPNSVAAVMKEKVEFYSSNNRIAGEVSGERKIVHLWECVGAFVIIEAPTGVFYSNQTGGTACGHPEVEGYLVPVERYSDMEEIANITRDYWYEGGLKLISKGALKQLAKVIKELQVIIGDGVNEAKVPFCTLDTDRLDAKCGEAWVPVKTPWGPGWLTWENSD